MKFVIENTGVSFQDTFILAQVDLVERSFAALNMNDCEAAQETFFDLAKLYDNVTRFDVSDQLRHLLGTKSQEWGVQLTTKAVAMESIGSVLKKTGAAVWDAILTVLGKLKDLVMKFFKKDRTAEVVKNIPKAQETLKKPMLALTNEEPTAEQVVDDKAQGAAGQVAEPKVDVIPRSKYDEAVKAAAEQIATLQNRYKELEQRQQDVSGKLQDANAKLGAQAAEIGNLETTKLRLMGAVSAAAKTVAQSDAKIADLNKAKQGIEFALSDQARLIRLQLSFYQGCLSVVAKVCGSIESVIKRSLSVETVKNVKDLLDGKLTMQIPASAIPQVATEISRLVTAVENTQFDSAEAFIDWRENCAKGLTYVSLDGVTPTLNPKIEKANSTLGKLGYVKDILSGEAAKKYEGTAAVANKINALLARLESDAKKLQSIQVALSDMK